MPLAARAIHTVPKDTRMDMAMDTSMAVGMGMKVTPATITVTAATTTTTTIMVLATSTIAGRHEGRTAHPRAPQTHAGRTRRRFAAAPDLAGVAGPAGRRLQLFGGSRGGGRRGPRDRRVECRRLVARPVAPRPGAQRTRG